MEERSRSQLHQTDDPDEGIGDRTLFLPEGEPRSAGTTQSRNRTRLVRRWFSMGTTVLTGSGTNKNQHLQNAEEQQLRELGLTAPLPPLPTLIPEDSTTVQLGSTAPFPPVLTLIPEDSTTVHSQPEEDPKLHPSSSSDHIRIRTPRPGIRTPRPETQGETLSANPVWNGAIRPEEQGQNRARLSNLFRRMRIYGNKSIWHLILYGPDRDDEEHPRSDILCTIMLLVVLALVTFYVTKTQQNSWPQEPDTYSTDNATIRGPQYTCGCILPPSLQSPENPTPTTNLNLCYLPSQVESVTILMFSNSTSAADAFIRQVISDNEVGSPINVTVDYGLKVTQEAHELTVSGGESGFSEFLAKNPDHVASLYPGNVKHGFTEDNLYALVEDLQHLDFPSYSFYPYIQMFWVYDCNNCSTCSLEKMNSLSTEVVNGSWVSCYYYGEPNRCADLHNYTAKCVVYPPEALPVQFAVQTLLESFINIPGISNIRGDYIGHPKNTALQPDVLYLNSSTTTNSTGIKLGFLEILKGSALWLMLKDPFPTLEIECANLPMVQVCDRGRSICNVFFSGADLQIKCYDFANHSDCEPLGQTTPDNEYYNDNTFPEILCPDNITCWQEFPYLVTWNISEFGETDALNSFLASNVLQDEWDQLSGMCTKTYTNVIRYSPYNSEEIFLESECVNATAGQSSFCWTTGHYHNLSDLPTDNWGQLPSNTWWSNDTRFVCYRMRRQKFKYWFITFFGILFGWYGTIVLVFYAVFSNWVLIRRKMSTCRKA